MADTDRTMARKARSGDLGSLPLAVNPEIPSTPGGTVTPGVSHAQDQRIFTCWVLLAAEGSAAATSDVGFMWIDRTIEILSARVQPQAALTANDSNFATVSVQSNNDAGGGLTSLASQTTKTAGSGGTGSWTSNQSVPLTPAANPVAVATPAAPLQIHFTTTKGGTGVVVPACMIELVYQEI